MWSLDTTGVVGLGMEEKNLYENLNEKLNNRKCD